MKLTKESKESFLGFATRHRFGIACLIMIVSSLSLAPALTAGMQGDTSLYQTVASDLFNGILPYRDQTLEYPPYAVPIFLLPGIFGEDNYLNCFIMFAFAADWLMKLLLLSIGLRFSNTSRALLPLLLYSVTIPFLRFFLLQRYDLYPALISLVSIWFFSSRWYFFSGLVLAAGIGVKVYPAVFVPPLFLLAVRYAGWKRFTAGLALGILPMVLLSFFLPWWRFAEFQTSRGLQVESLYASVLWLGKLLGLLPLDWVYVQKWYELQGGAVSAILPTVRWIFIGAVLGSTIVASRAAAQVSPDTERSHSIPRLARLLLVPLLAFVAFNQVLSPQYMIWLVPLAALASLEGTVTPVLLILMATIVTPVIYPSLFDDYGSGLGMFETMILLARNIALVIAWALLIREMLQSNAAPHAARRLSQSVQG